MGKISKILIWVFWRNAVPLLNVCQAKKNPSGVVSIQVIDKSTGKYNVRKTIGSSSDSVDIERLYKEGKEWLKYYGGQYNLFSAEEQEMQAQLEVEEATRVLDKVEKVLINGTEQIQDKVFRQIGFDAINDVVLKQLVIARICQPSSKSGTVDYLKSYYD